MKIIKKLVILFIFILVIVIYITNKDDKIYYISIGDELSSGINTNNNIGYGYSDYVKDYLSDIDKLEFYTKKFSTIDKRTTDLINDINNNIEIIESNKKIKIKYSLMHADIITISIGLNELLYKLNNESIMDYEIYEYIDEISDDIEKLINIIKKYCKEDIMLLGYYNPFVNSKEKDKINNYIIYANNELMEICEKEKIYYIDLYNLFKNNNKVFTNINSYYPNNDGYKLISKKITEIIKKDALKTLKTM